MTGMLSESSENAVVLLNLPQRVTMCRIREMAADHYGVTVADLVSKRRQRTVVRPRQVAMYFCKKLTPRSYPEIGRFFGGRDHSTVIHAYRTVEDLLGREEEFKKKADQLWRKITDAEPLPTIEIRVSEEETIEIPVPPPPPPPPPPEPTSKDKYITLCDIRREVAEYYEIPLATLTEPPTTSDAHFYCDIVRRCAYQVDLMHKLPVEERRTVNWDKLRGDRLTRDDMKVIWHRLMLLEQ